ncbi:hypothetical protein ACFXPZ_18035 [Streptomyces sp. NPDC059101]|uniref:ParB/RepB/Spo0J family partition protein n=1 Tax=Streptomyces sp. NPDC059101 TaxID=3346728 RepID=UPI0036AB2D01
MAGRRTSLASLAGQKVDDVPGKSDPLLLTLPLVKLVPTRFNPRRNFGTEDDLRDFGLKLKKRQLTPAVVVSRTGYLKLWPDEEENLGAASYVIANGERRYRSSLLVGRTTLNVVHNEDVAKSRTDFLDAVLAENIDRENLDPIERALGIETMVVELGGADKVAAHYDKTKGWVSQQRKLLKLVPELQALVSGGDLAVRIARDIAGLPATEQVAAWRAEQQRREEEKQRRAASPGPRRRKADPSSSTDAVQSPEQPSQREAPAPAEAAGASDRFTAVNQEPAPRSTDEARSQDSVTALVPAQHQATQPSPSATADPASLPAPSSEDVGHAIEELVVLTDGDAGRIAKALVHHLPSATVEALAESLLTHVG